MAVARTMSMTLAELRDLSRPRLPARRARVPEVAIHVASLVAKCRTLAVEHREGGLAMRLRGETERGVAFVITCTLHGTEAPGLTAAESAVVELLCEGRTRAQIARVRGVSMNTIKSQIRHIFRKLNVDTRVALVRRWCP